MSESDRIARVRACYAAYESGDPTAIQEAFADDFTFYAPPDPGIDLATYWERCWPAAGHIEAFEFVRLFEHGDEVFVTYESRRENNTSARNTEIHTFDGDKIVKVEVYFGWDL